MRPLLLLVLITQLPATAPGPSDALELPAGLHRLLADGTWDATPPGFRAITLSMLADTCAAQGLAHPARRAAAEACVERTWTLGRALHPKLDLASAPEALALTHLALVLGAQDRLGPCRHPAEHAAAAQRLAQLSLSDGWAHAPSYASVKARWPADQAATLAALHRYDVAHGQTLAALPTARWREVVTARGRDASTGLPRSDVTLSMGGAKYPRGCANAFLARYTAEFDAPLAAAWWQANRAHFLVRPAGLWGFREWPQGVVRAADVDSGPIVLGVGTAASALSIAAARAQGDEGLATAMETSASAAMALGAGQGAPELLIAQAILALGHSQPRLVPEGTVPVDLAHREAEPPARPSRQGPQAHRDVPGPATTIRTR